jgi:aspartate racemase
MRLSWNYNTELFDASTVERMARHFEQVVEAAVESPHRRVSEIELLSEEERRRLQMEWNETLRDYPRDLCIHELFEAQAAKTPDAVAITFGGREVSYRELNESANRLAHFLRGEGVGAESLVGVMMERSVEMVVALLGVLKAGGAYVPLDPSYPQERLSFMLEDASVGVLLTQRHLSGHAPAGDHRSIRLDSEWERITRHSAENPRVEVGAQNLAYVIYTSGSTGRPKGVGVPHRGVARLVMGSDYAEFSADEVFLQLAPISFDASTFEVWGSLLHGARLVVMPPAQPSLEEIASALREHRVTTLWLTAGLFHLMADEQPEALGGVRQLLAGGDVLSAAHVRKHLAAAGPDGRLINGYGPTESTTFTCSHAMTGESVVGDGVPIGRPIANTEVYILGRNLEPAPVGVTGELYIGGDGLARGYLGRAGITAERFIPHPYGRGAGERLYRSGDLARYRADGTIEFVGRVDGQVKLRGFRIELGEVEAALAGHASVGECVVVAREDEPGDKRLVAYVVGAEGRAFDGGELKEYMREHLPEYMVPSAFVLLPEMPLTPNGKVDRRALPASGAASPKQESTFVAPRNVLELRLKRIWEKILGVQLVGVKDNFFELGGHSLLAVRLMNETQKSLGRSLPLATLFRQPTIEGLAALMRQEPDEAGHSSVVEIQPEGAKRPFFCVHPVGGNVLCYYDLARLLGADQPFYGLQSSGIDGRHAPDASVEAMAARYIQEMRVVQPEGPYMLGGWSMGGVVAFEMAQQLRASGQDVHLLALFDSVPRGGDTTSYDDALVLRLFAEDIAGMFDLNLSQLRKQFGHLEFEEQLAEIGKQARDSESLPPGFDLPQVRNLLEVFRANLRALRGYEPKPYGGEVTVFPAAESAAEFALDARRVWGALATGGLNVHQLPGNHYTILNRPQVETLSALLKIRIEAAGDARGLGALPGDPARAQVKGSAA